jgi:hypothetical protein
MEDDVSDGSRPVEKGGTMGSIPGFGSVASSFDRGTSINSSHVSVSTSSSSSNRLAFEDSVALESVPSSPQLKHLASTDRTEFQQTVANAVRELRAAASQTSDSSKAGLLSSLANRFQQLEETGVVLP